MCRKERSSSIVRSSSVSRPNCTASRVAMRGPYHEDAGEPSSGRMLRNPPVAGDDHHREQPDRVAEAILGVEAGLDHLRPELVEPRLVARRDERAGGKRSHEGHVVVIDGAGAI